MNVVHLFRAVDALLAFRDAAKRVRGAASGAREDAQAPDELQVQASSPSQGPGGPLEARLANVVVAALKEAFDRDHARLELERTHLEEERRRAEAAMQAELRRQAADRELARLRLLAGAALVGWIASVAIVASGVAGATMAARSVLALGWVLLLAALGAAFAAQRRTGETTASDSGSAGAGASGVAALWLLITGLAATALSLLV